MTSYFLKSISFIYARLIRKKQQEINFWILYSFLITFIISRLIVYHFPDFFLIVRRVHIHHFAYGILLLAISGFISLHNVHWRKPRSVAILFGVGLALAVDEFGMWIRLEDNYWYRWSYDAAFVVGSALASFVYFGSFWKKIFANDTYRKRFFKKIL